MKAQMNRIEQRIVDLEQGQTAIELRLDQTEIEIREMKSVSEALQHTVQSLDDSVNTKIEELKRNPVWLRQLQMAVGSIFILWLIVVYILPSQ